MIGQVNKVILGEMKLGRCLFLRKPKVSKEQRTTTSSIEAECFFYILFRLVNLEIYKEAKVSFTEQTTMALSICNMMATKYSQGKRRKRRSKQLGYCGGLQFKPYPRH